MEALNGRGLENTLFAKEKLQTDAYFQRLLGVFSRSRDVSSVVVAHMVSNSVHFLPIIDRIAPIKLLLPKPNTQDKAIAALLKKQYPHATLSRDWAKSANKVVKKLERLSVTGDLIFIDIGGYFANSLAEISQKYKAGRVIGAMEGTENGVDKYNDVLAEFSLPICAVADSRLKYPENHLVGVSVVHSIESVIRELAGVIQQYQACVIGYGKVGRSVAEALRGRGVQTIVCDTDPVAAAEASARGFVVIRSTARALTKVNLVIGATGRKSLGTEEFRAIQPGTLIATVTSSDDEFDQAALKTGWASERLKTSRGTRIVTYRNSTTHFSVLNNGDTINFLHGAVIGPAIQLIEGEKLAAICKLINESDELPLHVINSVSAASRKKVAQIWLDHFLKEE